MHSIEWPHFPALAHISSFNFRRVPPIGTAAARPANVDATTASCVGFIDASSIGVGKECGEATGLSVLTYWLEGDEADFYLQDLNFEMFDAVLRVIYCCYETIGAYK